MSQASDPPSARRIATRSEAKRLSRGTPAVLPSAFAWPPPHATGGFPTLQDVIHVGSSAPRGIPAQGNALGKAKAPDPRALKERRIPSQITWKFPGEMAVPKPQRGVPGQLGAMPQVSAPDIP